MFEHQRHRGHGQRVGGQHVERERVAHLLDGGGQQRVGHAAADVVHDDVEFAERLNGLPGQFGGGFGLGQIGDDDVRSAAECLDLGCYRLQFGLRPRGDEDVGADFGERDSDRGAKPTSSTGDYGHLSVEAESVQDHIGSLPLSRFTVTR